MPAAKKPAAKVATKVSAASKKTKAQRNRRSPYQLVQDLKDKRDALAMRLGKQIEQLDQRIAQLEAKHAARIAIQQLTSTKTAEELEREEAALKQQLALMRKARKAASR